MIVNPTLYLMCFVAGVIGILAHLIFLKLPAVKQRALAANLPFSLKAYLREDCLAIIASFLTVVICVFVLDELIGYNPSLLRFIKFLFVFVGYTGSSILVGVFGKFDAAVQNIVDRKTNELDAIKQTIDEKIS
jgi:hypothetical protein